ncbi:unnamed protein product [Cuscuta campestris]|uniref:Pentacotripeptide-repeat region of PRORP domain-containing protein n=1 Tax=Cuscuta campestris TaxID=132261 RepID=A0A484KM57_9ASTE|nr:unnamed protein product [Cuscuta campestris]
MASYVLGGSIECQLVKTLCGIVLKGHWKALLKPKTGFQVNSAIVNQTLLKLSPCWFWLSWSFFKWVETIPNYRHSLQSSWTMICILTKHKHFKSAKEILHQIAHKDFVSCPRVLKTLVSDDDYDVNSQVLSWLVIFYAKNSKSAWDAIQVLEHMNVSRIKPDPHACTVLLNSLVKEGLTDTMWKTHKKMMKLGVVPNIHIYNVLIHGCCKSGNVEKADELLSEMEFKGIFPDLHTFNTMISMYCRRGMHYEALCMQDRMKMGGVGPDIITYNSLVHGYCREGRMREAMRMFKDITDERGKRDAHITPNQVTYNILIDGYCRAGETDEALRLCSEMEEKGLFPGIATYNSILRKLCEDGQMKESNKLLSQMSEKKIEPDSVTCNTLINGYCKVGDVESALKVKNKMVEAGLTPDSFTYKALIHGFCKARKPESAKDVIFSMILAGFSPGYCSYSWLVDAYTLQKDNEEDYAKLADEFLQRGICVDISFYRAIIRRLCRRGKLGCAERVFWVMTKERGISGDSVVCTSLAYAYFREGNMKGASDLLDEMYRRRLMVTLKLYKSLNASYRDDNGGLVCLFWNDLWQRGLLSKSVMETVQLNMTKCYTTPSL